MIVLPAGADPVGLTAKTVFPGPNCWPCTWKPSCSSSCLTSSYFCPRRSPGIGTCDGPFETFTVTVPPGATGEPALGDWLTMMPVGWLLATCTGLSWMLLDCAQPWMTLMSSPTRDGSDMPVTTST